MKDNQPKRRCLIEVSWEVCNKVGGINTVLSTKAKYALKNFADRYIAIGPWVERNDSFVEGLSPILEPVAKILQEKNIPCRFGYWETPLCPPIPTILVGYKGRYKIDDVLYRLWSNFGVDSLASNFEYIEPILFSTAAGEVMQLIQEYVFPDEQVMGHFHEWLCGAGILYVQQYASTIATIFTTHATVLGRALAGAHQDIYHLMSSFDPDAEAKKYGVFAKHSMEHAAAVTADCFTTVSSITAEESLSMLGKYPEKIVLNGLDMDRVRYASDEDIQMRRKKLLSIASRITRKPIPDNALIFITAGRYEFHNKGYDVFLKSLATLEQTMEAGSPQVVALFLIGGSYRTEHDSLLNESAANDGRQSEAIGIATHRINNPYEDPIIKLCNELNLRYANNIHVVFSDAYLSGSDGVFNLLYEEVLEAADLSIFPSVYEPWGYTPLESISYGTPTVTTDVAGFGCWVSELKENSDGAVHVLARKNKIDMEVVDELQDYLKAVLKQVPADRSLFRQKAIQIAKLADWKFFYNDYLDAYDQACEFNDIARLSLRAPSADGYGTCIHDAEVGFPRLRSLEHESHLPEALSGLRTFVNNFWWSWNDVVTRLLQELDPKLWEKSKHNPVYFLNFISNATLMKKVKDAGYMKKYGQVLAAFQNYMNDEYVDSMCDASLFSREHPIAYFCLEYAIDECLSIYSGGLGILAGDYLKVMSDLNVPMIAVGLYYKQGYFIQKLNSQGEQIADYDTKDPNQLPMRQLTHEEGKPLTINIEVLGRVVHVSVWEVKVGRVSLYLLDTDVLDNSPEDRLITDRLYVGTSENRLIQEIVLGVGGVRLISDHLKVVPALYHLNEGHSAFLLLERIQMLCNQGLSYYDASWVVKASSVFTTHTSVPAGNEVYSEALIQKYGAKAMELLKIPMEVLLELSRPGAQSQQFSMPAVAIRLTGMTNAVSRIHRQVVCSMWKDIWKGFLEDELPITYVTNGVHLLTWLGASMKKLFDQRLNSDWVIRQDDPAIWEAVKAIPDEVLWNTRQEQKEKLIDVIRARILKEYAARNESKLLIKASLDALSKNTLLMCLSRRFATYKRHELIFKNRERLAKLLTDEERPVVLIVAGKAHPADGMGKDKIHFVIQSIRDEIFKGHIIFIENYDIDLARSLTQGSDVWLNNPIRYTEACGTSGMKAGINGGLNLSIRDGWWDEAYTPEIGWAIENFDSHGDDRRRDEMESMFLLDTLAASVIPTYYQNKKNNLSPRWMTMMKASIASIACQFNTVRMARDYFERVYNPVAIYSKKLTDNHYEKLALFAQWEKGITNRFTTVKIKTILIDGIKERKVRPDGMIRVTVLLFSGKVKASELKVELLLVKTEENQLLSSPIIIPLELADSRESGVLTYSAEYQLTETGFFSYGIRVLPTHPLLFHPQDTRIAIWG